ncbi:cytochrome P450 2K1-like [Solea senegalensis]|uniref:Cytochrome P450 2K1-like n=1 Tax=Solea senegalensis TaxID=28829 RepID=A0AAV6RKP4_SOLSE|nr:cytochrome P450 2K1-like [Solea senegalensis]
MMFEDLPSSTSLFLFGTTVALLVLHVLHFRVDTKGNRREPPGPKPLPLLGNLLQVDLKRLDASLFDLAKKYGPVFTVYLGPKKVVVLAGYKTVKTALVNYAEEFGDREVMPVFYDFNKGHGILFTNGDIWKEMRRFALSTLRDFGMGRRTSEEAIIEECHHLVEEFEQHKGEAFNNRRTVSYASSNVISALMFGKRFDYKDPEIHSLLERDTESIRLTGSASILIYNAFPWLGPCLKNWRALMKNVEDSVAETKRIIADLKETLNPDMCRCFIDVFLSRKQRLEGTTVFPLLTSVLYDESRWESPHTFNPSHFLDKEGRFVKRDAFMPFSAGRRVCLGESLARMELFLFFTSLLQHFRFTPPPGVTEDELSLTPFVGFTLSPLPHELCAITQKRDTFIPCSAGARYFIGESLAKIELFLFFTSLL